MRFESNVMFEHLVQGIAVTCISDVNSLLQTITLGDKILSLSLCKLVNFHDFLSSADFFQNHLFLKILSEIPSEFQKV